MIVGVSSLKMTMKIKVAAVIIASLCLTPVVANADTHIDWGKLENHILAFDYQWMEDSQMVWVLQWWIGIEQDGVYGRATHKHHRQWAMERNIPVPLYSTVNPNATFNDQVEQWRPLVREAILANGGPLSDTARFLNIIACESGGDPNAQSSTSTAAGLMQHIQPYWENRARLAGFPGASALDPVANVYTSAWLIYRATGGGWQHWVCS